MGLAIHIVQPNEPKPDETAFATSHGRQGIHHRQQRKMGQLRRSQPERTPTSQQREAATTNDRLLHWRINLDRLTTDVANRRDSEENVSLAVYGILNG